MVVFNGKLYSDQEFFIGVGNTALSFGHSVLEEIRIENGLVLFWEPHYLKIMASMRMLRIHIPMSFTPDFLEEIMKDALSKTTHLKNNAIAVFQAYPSEDNIAQTDYHISFRPLENLHLGQVSDTPFEIGLYKDFYIANSLLSTLPTNYKLVERLAGVFSDENDFQSCFLLNEKKEVIGTHLGPLFVVSNGQIQTSPIDGGTQNSVFRKEILSLLSKDSEQEISEGVISPFSLQKADALFIFNPSKGFISVSKYRKKVYEQFEFVQAIALKFQHSIQLKTAN
jgi:branched-chain amino acid aminotransferase